MKKEIRTNVINMNLDFKPILEYFDKIASMRLKLPGITTESFVII